MRSSMEADILPTSSGPVSGRIEITNVEASATGITPRTATRIKTEIGIWPRIMTILSSIISVFEIW